MRWRSDYRQRWGWRRGRQKWWPRGEPSRSGFRTQLGSGAVVASDGGDREAVARGRREANAVVAMMATRLGRVEGGGGGRRRGGSGCHGLRPHAAGEGRGWRKGGKGRGRGPPAAAVGRRWQPLGCHPNGPT